MANKTVSKEDYMNKLLLYDMEEDVEVAEKKQTTLEYHSPLEMQKEMDYYMPELDGLLQ